MLDVCVIPRCMMSTRQWSRPETDVCWETTCRHTVTFAAKVCCARTRFKAKFLFRLVLYTLPAESETDNALVVVCCGERRTRSTERITERGTAQTERILDKTCDHSTPLDGRSLSSYEKRNNNSTTSMYCVCSILCRRASCYVHSQLFLSPHFAHGSGASGYIDDSVLIHGSTS